MQLIDTHAHLNDERFSDDLDQVLIRAKEAGLTKIILASADLDDCVEEQRIAADKSTPDLQIFCTVGIHPHEASKYTNTVHEQLRSWVTDRAQNRIVAIGEIGLDYYYDHSPRETQRHVFRKQLTLAYEMDIPVVLHERDAAGDSLQILDEFYKAGKLRSTPGVCHCFSGSVETAQILLSYDFYLGFDGPITFRNNRKSPDVIRITPLDRLLIETDCPYLTPIPFRGQRNEPAYVSFVLAQMAQIKGIPTEEMASITMENACRLFGM
jgi:TatD DNase family protein